MKQKKIHSKEHLLDLTSEDIRWGTPEVVAEYRAKRLQCDVIVDLCCGVGLQSFAFAKYCKNVYAVEKDKDKVIRARKNAAMLGITNIDFIEGDVLSEVIIKQLKKAGVSVVFCDPERLPEEKERGIHSIVPDVSVLLEKYGLISSKIAIEFPPQMRSISFDCEREYISVDGFLNRLTLYFDDLKKCERSAVILPRGKRLCDDSNSVLIETITVGKYLYEVDPAVVKAGLVQELTTLTGTRCIEKGKAVYCTNEEMVENHFFKNAWMVLAKAAFDRENIVEQLQKVKARNVVLRFSVDPQQYGWIRKGFERDLKGKKIIHLFKFGKKAVVGEWIKNGF